MNGPIEAFIAFLNCEANQAEARAKALRTTAAAIEANLATYERARKRSKPTKTQSTSRTQQGYRLYVQENYDAIKQQFHLHGQEDSNKAILATTAQRWNEEVNDEEKQQWQIRADKLKSIGLEMADTSDTILEAGMLETNQLRETEDRAAERKNPACKPPPDESANMG
ncbi:hypothetical protein ACA910_016756 [Epithemia clementina (nom. ined.)]